jgi:hypothetical protein
MQPHEFQIGTKFKSTIKDEVFGDFDVPQIVTHLYGDVVVTDIMSDNIKTGFNRKSPYALNCVLISQTDNQTT